MSDTGKATISHVVSADGTEIAYWKTGEGPPLVLVHGAPADHTRWDPLLPHLTQHVTVYAIDRRGRGASSDGPRYDITLEFEDVAAVVEAVSDDAGSVVDVYGHSFGGCVAFGAAGRTSRIRKLALYEGWPLQDPSVLAMPPDLAERLATLQAEGNGEGLLESFMREGNMISDDDIQAMRSLPSWPGRVNAALALPRELGAIVDARLDAAQGARIKVPTLLLTGEGSSDPARRDIEAVAAVLPDARIVVLESQEHVADIMAPEVFAAHLLSFLRDGD